MYTVIAQSLSFMKASERVKYFSLLVLRGAASLLDLIGILAIGFLATSVAVFLTQGSDPSRTIEVGEIQIPAVSASSLPVVALLILLLFLAKAVISILLTRQLANFLAKIEARSARVIAKKSFKNDLETMRKTSREDLMFAIQMGSPNAFHALLNSLGVLVAEGFLFVLVIGSFAFIDPIVAVGAVIYFGLIGFLIHVFIGRLMERAASKMAQSVVDANVSISDLGDVFREATILGRTEHFIDKVFHSRLRVSSNAARQFVLSGMPRYIVETALIFGIAVFILIQSTGEDTAASAATIGVFLSGGLRLTASLLPLQSALLTIKQAIPPAQKALGILHNHTDQEEFNFTGDKVKEEHESSISVSVTNLHFSFQDSELETLKNVSLEISGGQQAAFIGLSGAGKSTLADLILGLLEPSAGTILIDGQTPQQFVRQNPGLIGYVPQRPGMITGTIAENIALGIDSSKVDKARLERAIQNANLKEFVSQLPNGLDTDVGKRKDEFSGGQLQRIGLARALYSQPRLLVMDEATSALDAESEEEINRALGSMRGEVTIILIAHRLNTIQRSDIVFLIEEGQITSSGSFQSLLKSSETVRNLAKLMSIDNLKS